MFHKKTAAEKYHFKDQYPDEKVILMIHRHWTILAGHGVVLCVLLLLPLVFFLVGPSFFPILFDLPYSNLIFLILILYLAFVWLYFFTAWVDYYLDAWIITDKRIIDIEQKGLFRRIVAEQSLDKVQDVTSEINGMVETFMDYGTVIVQTAGTDPRFTFEDVPQPQRIKDSILKISKKYVQTHPTYEKQPEDNANKETELPPTTWVNRSKAL